MEKNVMEGFTLLQATKENAEEITEVYMQAFADEPIRRAFHAGMEPTVLSQVHLQRRWNRMAFAEKSGRFIMLVENATKKVVGFCHWDLPNSRNPSSRVAKWSQEDSVVVPPGHGQRLRHEFQRRVYEGRQKYLDPSRTYFLHTLAILPSHQRRELGTMLIQAGLKEADEAGAPVFLEATEFGRPLYLKLGWKDCEYFDIDLETFGGKGVARTFFMIREPSTQRENWSKA